MKEKLVSKALHSALPSYISTYLSVYNPDYALCSVSGLWLSFSLIPSSHSHLQDFSCASPKPLDLILTFPVFLTMTHNHRPWPYTTWPVQRSLHPTLSSANYSCHITLRSDTGWTVVPKVLFPLLTQEAGHLDKIYHLVPVALLHLDWKHLWAAGTTLPLSFTPFRQGQHGSKFPGLRPIYLAKFFPCPTWVTGCVKGSNLGFFNPGRCKPLFMPSSLCAIKTVHFLWQTVNCRADLGSVWKYYCKDYLAEITQCSELS